MKKTFIKWHADAMGRSEDILGWEKVTEEELKSDEFKQKKAEWSEYVKGDHSPLLVHVG